MRYQMPSKASAGEPRKRRTTSAATALRELDRHRVAHLATADTRGKPLVVPICFACGRDRIYSVVDEKPKRLPAARLRRLRNIRANPQVALLADYYEEDWSRLAYILVEGTAKLLTNGAEHIAAIRKLRDKYPQYRKMALADKPVIKISPRKMIHWKARR
jgi:PPOX class probable F420-dependent enzyme